MKSVSHFISETQISLKDHVFITGLFYISTNLRVVWNIVRRSKLN